MKHVAVNNDAFSRHDEAVFRRLVSATSAAVVLLVGLVLGYAAFYWFSMSDASVVIVNGTAASRGVNYHFPWPGQTVFFAPAQWVDRHLRPTYWQWRVEHKLRINLRSLALSPSGRSTVDPDAE